MKLVELRLRNMTKVVPYDMNFSGVKVKYVTPSGFCISSMMCLIALSSLRDW